MSTKINLSKDPPTVINYLMVKTKAKHAQIMENKANMDKEAMVAPNQAECQETWSITPKEWLLQVRISKCQFSRTT